MRPLSSELPRQAASREPALLTIAGATKSAATQPRPTIPQRTGACALLTCIPPPAHGPVEVVAWGRAPWIPETVQRELVRLKPLDNGFLWCTAATCVDPSYPPDWSPTFLDT